MTPDEERSTALIHLGALLGWEITIYLDKDKIDATTFGHTSKTYLVGRTWWRARLRRNYAEMGTGPRETFDEMAELVLSELYR